MRLLIVCCACTLVAPALRGGELWGVGDPQLRTDHAWYPGELSCSTFERLFATQQALYEREVGRPVDKDEDRALAAWYWRNLAYYHESGPDAWYFGDELSSVREYWTGLFGFGFALCGTTHAQWTAEMQQLLGHARSRVVGVSGHNSFEVWLTGGQYGAGDWALLDHDISTVVFDDPARPTRLRNLWNIAYSTAPPLKTARAAAERAQILSNSGPPDGNRGWFISGLYYNHPTSSDAFGSLDSAGSVEPLAGYAGPPPMVHLRLGETFRRYLRPGLGGSTYCYWGRNVNDAGIPGPARGRTWVNRPQTMYRAVACTPHTAGQGRFGNGVFTYQPDFSDGSYREGICQETADSVTVYFYSPYVIATAPAGTGEWACRDSGGTQGLVVTGTGVGCHVQVSADNQATWSPPALLADALDLTDHVKGRQSYHLRFHAGAAQLAGKQLTIRTVVQCNDRLMPHLKDHGSTVTYQASGQAVFAAGPNQAQAQPFVTAGSFGSGSRLTMTVPVPAGGPLRVVHAAAWVNSSNPPTPGVRYQIECSTDGGAHWAPIVADWQITSPGGYDHTDVGDHWSQSFCYGSRELAAAAGTPIQVRFHNDGGKSYRKAEVYLVHEVAGPGRNRVRFNWTDERGTHTAERTYPGVQTAPDPGWTIATGSGVVTNWVEFAAGGADR